MADIRFSPQVEKKVKLAMKNAIAAVDQSGAFEEGSQPSPALLVAERRTVAFAVFGSFIGNENEFKGRWRDARANKQAQENREEVVKRFGEMLAKNPKFEFENGARFPKVEDLDKADYRHHLGQLVRAADPSHPNEDGIWPDAYTLQNSADLSNFEVGSQTPSTPGAAIPFAITAYSAGRLQTVARFRDGPNAYTQEVGPRFGRVFDYMDASRAKAAITAACNATLKTQTDCLTVDYH